MNKQREVIYAQRREVLDGKNIKDNFIKMMKEIADRMVYTVLQRKPIP